MTKFRFDNKEIEQMSSDWLEIVQVSSAPVYIDGEAENTILDDSDVSYIKKIMEENPKLERLMPHIIKEVICMYHSYIEEF